MKKLMLGLMIAFAVTAEATTYNYTLNESLTATFDDATGVLTINGNGAMPNWKSSQEQSWSDVYYKIQSVVAEGVTSVGDYAFAGCYSLASVSLPNATTIGEYAFYGCSKLPSVSLPNATTIGVEAFRGCKLLESVSLPNATTIGRIAFNSCGSLTSIVLPNATTIGDGAFDSCGSLTSVSLPNVTTIEWGTFVQCGSLTSVSLPNATTIEEGAFVQCGSLTSVSLPNATTIEGGAFRGCEKLETVVLSFGLLANPDRESWDLRNEAKLLEPFTNDEVKNAAYKVAVFAGEKLMSGENYEKGCAYYGLTPKTEPQVVKEGEIAVTKESLQAAKAMTVQIVNGQVALGVSVCSNADITASSVNWAPVKFTPDTQIGLSEDGTKLVLPIPVAAQQGFMILQSGDVKAVPSDGGTSGFYMIKVVQ